MFKDFVKENREEVDIDKIATGEHWYGKQAIELKLVDQLITSDDYLAEAVKESQVYQISFEQKRNWQERLFSFGANLLDKLQHH